MPSKEIELMEANWKLTYEKNKIKPLIGLENSRRNTASP